MINDTTVLVTRSGLEGERLCRTLCRNGVDAVHFSPVDLIGPENPEDCRRQLLEALPCDRLIAPSAEALRQAVALVGIDRLAGLTLIVPGPGTARVAESLGFADISCPASGGTSEDILQLPLLNQVKGLSVVVLAAQGGRETMGHVLSERGALLLRLHVYQRSPAALPAGLEDKLLKSARPVTLLASGGALQGLESALGSAAWSHLISGLMIAPSFRVARLAHAAGSAHVEVAEGADHGSMLSALARARSDLGVCVTLDLNSG